MCHRCQAASWLATPRTVRSPRITAKMRLSLSNHPGGPTDWLPLQSRRCDGATTTVSGVARTERVVSFASQFRAVYVSCCVPVDDIQ
eukprot:COSAG06_NODE_24_length_32981_cov_25.509671_32_plen_87_part_00